MNLIKAKIERERETCADLCEYMATLGEKVVRDKRRIKEMPDEEIAFAAGLIEGYRHAAEQIRKRGKDGRSQ